jgi:(p)ppGpp synthase/HD superfamily hydrolase
MDEKFKRRVDQLIKTIQFETVTLKTLSAKETLLSEFEQNLDEKLISFFQKPEIEQRLREIQNIESKTIIIELCDELQAPLPNYWSEFAFKSEKEIKQFSNLDHLSLEELYSLIPQERRENWSSHMKEIHFLFNELRYFTLTNGLENEISNNRIFNIQ